MSVPPAAHEQLIRQSAACLISSRLRILQSKRLRLNSVLLLRKSSSEEKLKRLERIRAEVERASENYQSIVLRLGSAQSSEYWLVAYSRLIASGSVLASKLRAAAIDLPAAERVQAVSEVEMLENLIQGWRAELRTSMVKAVA